MMRREWIGVDLDGTLAEYHGFVSDIHIGEPIEKMVDRVKGWIAEGKDVKIVTARVSPNTLFHNNSDSGPIIKAIQNWCKQHLGRVLPITHEKDFLMKELWDDRAIQVVKNTGERADKEPS